MKNLFYRYAFLILIPFLLIGCDEQQEQKEQQKQQKQKKVSTNTLTYVEGIYNNVKIDVGYSWSWRYGLFSSLRDESTTLYIAQSDDNTKIIFRFEKDKIFENNKNHFFCTLFSGISIDDTNNLKATSKKNSGQIENAQVVVDLGLKTIDSKNSKASPARTVLSTIFYGRIDDNRDKAEELDFINDVYPNREKKQISPIFRVIKKACFKS